eukprot:846026_1
MATARHTGTIISWNALVGEGMIMIRGSTDTYVNCSKGDIIDGGIEIGDTVSFVMTKDYHSEQLNATDIRKSYSHNNNQNKPSPLTQAHAPKHGVLHFQK